MKQKSIQRLFVVIDDRYIFFTNRKIFVPRSNANTLNFLKFLNRKCTSQVFRKSIIESSLLKVAEFLMKYSAGYI